MKDAGAKANDYHRMQVWAGQSAAMSKPIPAGQMVREIWDEAQVAALTCSCVLRLALVPLLIAAVTLASRRWGHRVGAFVTALPAVAGPTLVLLRGAAGTRSSLPMPRGDRCSVWSASPRSVSSTRARQRGFTGRSCLLLGWASFAVVTLLMYRVHVGAIVAFVIAVAALFGARALLPSPPSRVPLAAAGERRDGICRCECCSAAALVFALTSAADRLGSERERNPDAVSGRDGDPRRLHARAARIGGVRRVSAGLYSRVVRLRGLLRVLASTLPHLPIACVVQRGAGDAVGVADGVVQADL